MSLIIVAHPETGAIFTPTSNEGWMKCQLRHVGQLKVSSTGVISSGDRVCFPLIQKKVAEMPAFASLRDNDVFPIPGKIQRVLSRMRQWEDQNTVKKGDTDEDALINGSPYYQNYIFTNDLTARDEFWLDGEMANATSKEAAAAAAAANL